MNKHARKYDEANEGYLRVLSRSQQEDFFPEPKVAFTKELVYNIFKLEIPQFKSMRCEVW